MADEPKSPSTPPEAAGDKPASSAPGEPLKGEVSRTDSPGAGVSAAPVGPPRTEPPAPKPANPEGVVTATTSETSSATGQITASEDQAAAAKPAAPPAAARPAAPPAAAKPAVAPAAAAPGAARPAAAPAAKPAPPKPAGAAPEHAAKVAPPSGPPDPPPPADKVPPAFIAALEAAIPGSVAHISYFVGDWTIIVPAANIVAICKWLRESPEAAFDLCTDLTATDWPPRAERFDVVYCLYSIRHRHRVRVKAKVGEHTPIASVTPVWPSANWLEREVYDMFGITFAGHPDPRRILMPLDWQGYPQRKDYPLEGPGELLMENPIDWLRLRQAKEEAEIE
jgi:NADH-quinone oxidoreductase subunit C